MDFQEIEVLGIRVFFNVKNMLYAMTKKNGVGGFSKNLRNFQSGSWQMITYAYKVGGWGKKGQKCAYEIFEWSHTLVS